MKNSRSILTIIGALAIVTLGLWGAYGLNFSAEQATNTNNSSQTCFEGFLWDGSECVPQTSGTNDPNCASNYIWNGKECAIINSGTDPGTGGTNGNTGTAGTDPVGGTGISGNAGTNGTTPTNTNGTGTVNNPPAPSEPNATIEPITVSQLAVVFKGYDLSKSPFTSLARAGFSEWEMAWLGGEILRRLARNRERGVAEIRITDLVEQSQLLQEAREYAKK